MKNLCLTAGVIMVLSLLACPVSYAQKDIFEPTIVDLGAPGEYYSSATDINERGEIAGSCWSPLRAFLWHRGVWTDLGTLGGEGSYALGINNRGQVVGFSHTIGNQVHPFLWERGVMIDLGTLGGIENEHWAFAINNRGQVVGNSCTTDGQSHAFLWEKGVMIDLGTLGGIQSEAFDINNRGQIIGYSETASGEIHAFLWEHGEMIDLNEATDVLPFGGFAVANAINDRGQVVGFCSRHGSGGALERHPVLWEKGVIILLGEPCGLGTAGGACWSEPTAINARGQVVGWSRIYPENETGHAFLWEDGVMTDLGSLGGEEYESWASGINNRGEVVGGSETISFEIHATLWKLRKLH